MTYRRFIGNGLILLALIVSYHVWAWRSLTAQFPDLRVTTAIKLPPPCSNRHWFGTYAYSKDASGTKHWMYACRDWSAGRWVLVSLD